MLHILINFMIKSIAHVHPFYTQDKLTSVVVEFTRIHSYRIDVIIIIFICQFIRWRVSGLLHYHWLHWKSNSETSTCFVVPLQPLPMKPPADCTDTGEGHELGMKDWHNSQKLAICVNCFPCESTKICSIRYMYNNIMILNKSVDFPIPGIGNWESVLCSWFPINDIQIFHCYWPVI